MAQLRPPFAARPEVEGRAAEILEYLGEHGASFFSAIHEGTGGGFPAETVDALWSLVWQGLVTNDTMQPLRAYGRTEDTRSPKRSRGVPVSLPAARAAPCGRSMVGRGDVSCVQVISHRMGDRHGASTARAPRRHHT